MLLTAFFLNFHTGNFFYLQTDNAHKETGVWKHTVTFKLVISLCQNWSVGRISWSLLSLGGLFSHFCILCIPSYLPLFSILCPLRPLSPRRCLPLCHFLTLILQQLNPTLSLLKSICHVSVHLSLAHCLVFSCLPLSSTLLLFFLSVNPTCSPLYCTSHVSLSLCTWLSLLKPKGRGGLTLIDASDRGEEREMALGWQG